MMRVVWIAARVVLCGLVGAAALVGCGDSSGGGGDGDTQVADAGDTAQRDVPGPGQCELNWISGFTPFLGVDERGWDRLNPGEPGTVRINYDFVGSAGTTVRIDVQTCEVVDGVFRFSANSADKGDTYTVVIEAPNYPGLGIWQPGSADGLEVRLELRAVLDPSVTYLSSSTPGSQCEICVDATGRQGAFRCDDLLERDGERGGIRHAGFICPDGEPGFSQ